MSNKCVQESQAQHASVTAAQAKEREACALVEQLQRPPPPPRSPLVDTQNTCYHMPISRCAKEAAEAEREAEVARQAALEQAAALVIGLQDHLAKSQVPLAVCVLLEKRLAVPQTWAASCSTAKIESYRMRHRKKRCSCMEGCWCTSTSTLQRTAPHIRTDCSRSPLQNSATIWAVSCNVPPPP